MNKTIFAKKLAHYAKRNPKSFLQLDVFYAPEDKFMRPDKDGDGFMATATTELMHGADVRVLVPHDAEAKTAIRQLKKIAKWLSRSPNLLNLAHPVPEEDELVPEKDDTIPF